MTRKCSEVGGIPPIAGRPELLAEIRQRISAGGPLTFAEFMSLALYHPAHGYYSGSPGSRDYATSPQIHPAFGYLLARQLRAWWHDLGEPGEFHVVEPGGGAGRLARDVLAGALEHPPFAAALRYHLVEPRPPVGLPPGVVAHRSLAELASVPVGCVVSNELLDALPVHRVAVRQGRLVELYVGWRAGRLVEVIGEPSTPRIAEVLERAGARLREGARTEVGLAALDWLGEVAGLLHRGFVLTVDYGYEAHEYFSPERRQGTLLCYYRHSASDEPLLRVGEQDITAHVEFTSLMRHGESVGLEVVELTTQRAWLTALGIRDLAERLGQGLDAAHRLEAQLALSELIRTGGLGDFRVLVQRKRGGSAWTLSYKRSIVNYPNQVRGCPRGGPSLTGWGVPGSERLVDRVWTGGGQTSVARTARGGSGAGDAIPRDELMDVDPADVRVLCGEPNYEDALSLLIGARIENAVRRGTTIEAVFAQSRGRRIETSVAFGLNFVEPSCECRSDDRYCEHVGALLLAWAARPESFAEVVAAPEASEAQPRPGGSSRRATGSEEPEPLAELSSALVLLPIAGLRTIARRWGVRLRGNAKGDVVRQLTEALAEPAGIDRAIAALEPDLYLALVVVYLLGSESNDLPKPDEVAGALGRLHPTAGDAERLLKELRERGLVFATPGPTAYERLWVPRLFWPHLTPTRLVAAAPAPAEQDVRAAGTLADAVLALWASIRDGARPELRPPRRLGLIERADPGLRELGSVPEEVSALIASGRWQSNDRELTAPAREPELSDESLASLGYATGLSRPMVDFAWQLLKTQGLVEVGETVRTVDPPALALLRHGSAGRLHAILGSWQKMVGWSELDLALAACPELRFRRRLAHPNQSYYSPYNTLTRDNLDARLVDARRFLVRLLELLPTDVWLSVESLQEVVWKLWPDFLYGRERYATAGTRDRFWWLEADGRRLDVKRFADWRRGPGAVVVALVAGPLHWLGLADLAGPAEHPRAFRLRPACRLLSASPPPVGSDLAQVAIGPGLDVRVSPGHDDPAIHELLAMFGTLREASPRGFVYTLTIEGVRASFEAGHTADDLLASLRARTDRVPEEFQATLLRWWEAYGRLRLYEGLTLLEFADDFVLPELLAATGLRQQIVYQFSPRLVAIDPGGAEALIGELRRRGYTPSVEPASGANGGPAEVAK